MTKFTKFAVAAAFAFFAAAITASAYITVPPNVSMTSGSTEQVMAVQMAVGVTADGKFGPNTKNAVMSFQSTHGLTADGVVGAMTAAALNAMGTTTGTYPAGCTSSTGFSTTTGMPCTTVTAPVVEGCPAGAMFSSITGEACDGETTGGSTDFSGSDEGALENISAMGEFNTEEVGEDEEDVEVIGIEMDADGADQMITRVNVVIDNPTLGGSASDDLEDYISEVALMLDGEDLARMDVEDASYERALDEYTFRFTGLDGVIEEDETGELTVALTGVSNLGSDEEGEGWTISILEDAIRAESPNGTSDTYDNVDYSETFTVESFAASADLDLKASRSSDSVEEGTVIGDSNDDFDADLLTFELEADGSDMTIFGVEFDLTTSAAAVTDVTSDLTLTCGDDDWSENAAASVVFGDMEISLDDGDSIECTLSAQMLEIDGVTFAEGDTLKADLDVSETDAEDQTGESVDSGDLTGSANGFKQTFYSEGLIVNNFDTSTSITFTPDSGNTDAQVGKFVIEFDATANDVNVNLDKTGFSYTIQAAGLGVSASDTAVLECIADCGSSADNTPTDFFIADGDTETYRLTVTVTGDTDGPTDNFKVWLDSVDWDVAPASGGETFSSNMGEDSEADTGYLQLLYVA